jgi:hypothetical protein
MLCQAEKRRRSGQTFELAAGSQVETADLRYPARIIHFLLSISKA